jgi:hypothetical protein
MLICPGDVQADIERFLADRGLSLPQVALQNLLASIAREYLAAARTLHRRAVGDWGADDNIGRHPVAMPSPPVGPATPLVPRRALKDSLGSEGPRGVARAPAPSQMSAVDLLDTYAADRGQPPAVTGRVRHKRSRLSTASSQTHRPHCQLWVLGVCRGQQAQPPPAIGGPLGGADLPAEQIFSLRPTASSFRSSSRPG